MNIFKEIEGFEDYEIDNDGNVKSLRNDIILKPKINKYGYKEIALCKEGKKYYKRIHRLVAEAFIPNPLGLPYVNHKNEFEKTNNHVELMLNGNGNVVVDYEKTNLEWCDAKYNTNYGTANRRRSDKKLGVPKTEETKAKLKNHPLLSKPVVAVDKDNNIVMEFASTREAGRQGFNQGNVGACCRNCYGHLGNFYKGYYWYFKEDWEQIQKENASPNKREDA